MKRLLAAYALFSIGAGVMLFYLPMRMAAIGGSMLDVSLLVTIPAAVSMIFSGVWGKLSDELKTRKLFMILGMAAMSMFFISMLVLKTKFLMLLLLAGFTIFTCATEPATQAYVTAMPPKEKGAAAGRVNAYNYAGISAAALAGGFIYDRFGFGALSALSAVSAMAGTLLAMSLKENRNTFKAAETRADSRSTIYRLLPIYLFIFIFIVGMSAFSPISSVYLVQLGNSKTIYGAFTFLGFVAGGLMSSRIGRLADDYGRKRVLLAGALAYVAIFVFLYFVKSPVPSLLAWSVPIYPFGWIAAMALVADSTTSKERGLWMGLLNSSKNLGLIAGSFIGGMIATASIGNVLAFAAMVSAAGALLVLFSFKRA